MRRLARLGVVVALDLPDAAWQLLTPLLPPGVTDAGAAEPSRRFALTPDGDRWVLAVDGAPAAPPALLEAAAQDLLGEVELWWAEHAVGHVLVHAGAVAVDGRALLLPGRSLAGKTTLVRALLERGAQLLSDEYAVLRPDGLVLPYARMLSVRDPGRTERGRRVRSAAPVAEGPLPVGLVAVLRFTGTWSAEPLTPAAAALALLDNCVAAQSRTAECLTAVTAAASAASALTGTRDAAEPAASRLLDQLVRSDVPE